MKTFLTALAVFLTLNSFSQSADAIANALKEGNTNKFTSSFSSNVDIKFPKKAEMKNVTKTQAASIISNFFTSNGINSFEATSPSRELNGTTYIVGKLKGSSQNYNITVMLKSDGNTMEVITVRIS